MRQKKVLIIDDDLTVGAILNHVLTDSGYHVHYQTSLIGLQEVLSTLLPDVIILDVEIGNSNGIDFLATIKSLVGNTPVIFISSHSNSEFKIRAIKGGGIAYLVKPINNEELLAYVENFTNTYIKSVEVISFGRWTLSPENRALTYNRRVSVRLSKKEFALMRLLAANSSRVVLRSEILSELYDDDSARVFMDLSVNNFISSLRRHLSIDLSIEIRTVTKVGYKLFMRKSHDA